VFGGAADQIGKASFKEIIVGQVRILQMLQNGDREIKIY